MEAMNPSPTGVALRLSVIKVPELHPLVSLRFSWGTGCTQIGK